MTGLSRLASAANHLRSAYGSPELPEWSNEWTAFLSVLLVGPAAGPDSDPLKAVLESSALASPGRDVANERTGQLVELLSPIPSAWTAKGKSVASGGGMVVDSIWRSAVRGVVQRFGFLSRIASQNSRTGSGDGRRIADVSRLRLAVFPLDRATLRVAIRHGWLDFPIEDAEAQDFFVRGLAEAEIDPREFSRLVSRVAQAHCGRVPQCDGCPLQPLLPLNGPLNPDSC